MATPISNMATPMKLNAAAIVDKFIVPAGPPKALYIPDFITEDEERFLLRNVYDAPKPKWHQLSHRRLQNWGGLPHPNGMIVEELPEWLKKYVSRVTDLRVFSDKNPNHVLVNEYLSGQGIMAHTDGPLFHPVITTINLGSHTVLNLYEDEVEVDGRHRRNPIGSLFLRPRSLLVLQEELYTSCQHGIEEIHEDVITDATTVLNADVAGIRTGDRYERGNRVSVTIRHVPKTVKIKFR